MSAKNDITGDAIASKANSKSYRDNYENIFSKKATEKRVELDGGICNSKSNDGCGESQLREYAEGAGVQGQADQEQAVSAKCKAFSKSKLGLEPVDNRQAFYAGWEAAIASIEFNFCPRCGQRTYQKDWVHTCTSPAQEK